MRILFILIFLFSVPAAFAHELRLAPYIKMQEELAADDFNSALESHKNICDKELFQDKNNYKDCDKKFKSIEDLRTSFKALSELYLKHGDLKEMNKFQKATCPMAKAKWIQKTGALRNPYYGKSMLECGEKI